MKDAAQICAGGHNFGDEYQIGTASLSIDPSMHGLGMGRRSRNERHLYDDASQVYAAVLILICRAEAFFWSKPPT
jgi:hypothetical protein